MSATKALRVLYVVYWGALEPLGQSLVVPSVRRLARSGVEVTLLSMEKPADLADLAAVRRLEADLSADGIRWRALRYHKRPKWPATAYDSLTLLFSALRLRFARGRFDVVHARTFVAGPVGWFIARVLGARFIYHNEGFYPDEQVDGGVWRRDSSVHRLAKGVETFLYDHADGLIVLSQRARSALENRRTVSERGTPIVVVPSAVDLEAFRPPSSTPSRDPLRLVYLGSVGLRYRLDAAGRFVAALRTLAPQATLTVISRSDPALVTSMLAASGLEREAWTLKELAHEEVPRELARHHAGLFFLTEGLSEHGCSPTKIGEYWAVGLPVVTTPNVSDTDLAVRELGVGVVVSSSASATIEAARSLIALLADPSLKERCRQAAERFYSLERACIDQVRLYREVTA